MTDATTAPRGRLTRPLAISVVMIGYQQAPVLEISLLALLDQDFDGPWEIIVVDDGSTDGTFDRLRPYLQATDLPVVYAWQPDRGNRQAHARNHGIALSRGRALLFLDGDIVPSTDLVRRHATAQAAHPGLLAGNRLWRSWEADLAHLGDAKEKLAILRATAASNDPECRRHERHEQRLRFQLLHSRLPWRVCFSCHVSVPYSPAVVFDERMPGWGCGDAEFACRLDEELHLPVSYDPDLVGWQVESANSVFNVFRRNRHDEVVRYLQELLYFIDKYPHLRLGEAMTMGLDRLVLTTSGTWTVVRRGEGQPADETLLLARRWLAAHGPDHPSASSATGSP